MLVLVDFVSDDMAVVMAKIHALRLVSPCLHVFPKDVLSLTCDATCCIALTYQSHAICGAQVNLYEEVWAIKLQHRL